MQSETLAKWVLHSTGPPLHWNQKKFNYHIDSGVLIPNNHRAAVVVKHIPSFVEAVIPAS